MSNPYQKYKSTQVTSASKEQLLLLLYEGAIKFIKRAKIAIEKKNIADRGINIGRAFDIIAELNNTLDHEVGGEIANNLEQLYMFVTEQLTKANITGDVQHIDNCLKVLEPLHAGWKGAVAKVKKENANASKSTKA